MLFLFNETVFDLGDLVSVLQDGTIPLPAAQFETLTTGHLTLLLREALFVDPLMATNKPDRTKHLAALIAYRAPGANAVLGVRPAGATGPDDVGLRFANVPMIILTYLWKRQKDGALDPEVINEEVWHRVTENLHSAY
ncbi:hypothetical protein [Maricaulis salignorans]|uniref:Uncharacterized protein n=1 Tax=Maricaulis salignorans TaxID=144026 RepID=A0A1G9Q4G2_9PROT|nr:hypothetical protein [Maricaulis salignorans]SDM05793.1 hypothetical protein SAMN04488568_104157 [Maricaulis salignorans]